MLCQKINSTDVTHALTGSIGGEVLRRSSSPKGERGSPSKFVMDILRLREARYLPPRVYLVLLMVSTVATVETLPALSRYSM